MKAGLFAFEQPSTLDETLRLLADNEGARALAGGQSLVPMLNLRLAPAEMIVDIMRVASLREVDDRGTSVVYGAALRHVDFEDGRVVDSSNGLMQHVAGRFAYRAVRNRGTLGGALALADPAADWLTTVVALDAQIHVARAGSNRQVAAADFATGAYMTVLEDGELITAVEVPRLAAAATWGYYKVMRKTGEYADSMAIVVVDRAAARARVVLGAIDGAPLLLDDVGRAVVEDAAPARIEAVVDDALGASGRDFPAHRRLLHRTAVCRAIANLKQK